MMRDSSGSTAQSRNREGKKAVAPNDFVEYLNWCDEKTSSIAVHVSSVSQTASGQIIKVILNGICSYVLLFFFVHQTRTPLVNEGNLQLRFNNAAVKPGTVSVHNE